MTDEIERTLVQVPFGGFYESMWSQAIDHEEEQHAEYEAEHRQGEEGIPPELHLTAREIADILFDVTDYSVCYGKIAEEYVTAFNDVLEEDCGFDLKLEYEGMRSPKYYNFETDRLFAYIPRDVVRQLFAKSAENGHENLREVIKRRHTSYDGFHSWYSNKLDEWLEKPIDDWDHNELCTLLISQLDRDEEYNGGRDLQWQIYERIADCDGFHHEWSAGVDWKKYDEKVAELREEKLAALKEAAEEKGEEFVEPAYRCPDTSDLFKSKDA